MTEFFCTQLIGYTVFMLHVPVPLLSCSLYVHLSESEKVFSHLDHSFHQFLPFWGFLFSCGIPLSELSELKKVLIIHAHLESLSSL